MENDGKEILLNNDKKNDELNINIFNIDYENQKLENNINFNKWKESMSNKYNGKGKIYRCSFANHYFYGEQKDYGILCPSCNKLICIFCLNPIINSWNAKCCTKRKLYLMHFNGKRYLNPDERNHFYDSENEYIIFIIPGINFIFLIGIFLNAFFYKIVRKNYDAKNYDLTYESFLRRKDKFYWALNIAINGITSLILVIPFLIFNITISILLIILIIIRRKWYMYLIGFFHEDWYFLNKNLKKIC